MDFCQDFRHTLQIASQIRRCPIQPSRQRGHQDRRGSGLMPCRVDGDEKRRHNCASRDQLQGRRFLVGQIWFLGQPIRSHMPTQHKPFSGAMTVFDQ
jgi:hypothetical protein